MAVVVVVFDDGVLMELFLEQVVALSATDVKASVAVNAGSKVPYCT